MEAMRTVDDISSDFANAGSDTERASLIREMDAMNAEIADEHLRAGHVSEYQHMIGWSHQQRRIQSNNAVRVKVRMGRGEL